MEADAVSSWCNMIPVVAIGGYMAYPKQFRINPSLLYYLSLIHNGLLVSFSAWTFISLAQILYSDGIVFEANYYFKNPHYDKIIYYFYLSKYYEFFDTFLLYLNGRTPIFLQKFHHIGAVLGWHFLYIYKVDGVWVSTLFNSFVHTIMYSYYLGCLLKINQVRFIKRYITTLQIAQMVGGQYHVLVKYKPPVETYFNYSILLLCDVYIFGLLILFARFYYNTYVKNKQAITKII